MQEEFTFFWHGPLSQWDPSTFQVAGIEFNCAEQFMMYSKALLFGDKDKSKEILAAASPREQKKLGQKVYGFKEQTWKIFREGIVYTGSYAKFTQNSELEKILLATKETTLVEASPFDQIWGVGLGETDPRIHDRKQWRGENLLGEILMRVRSDRRLR